MERRALVIPAEREARAAMRRMSGIFARSDPLAIRHGLDRRAASSARAAAGHRQRHGQPRLVEELVGAARPLCDRDGGAEPRPPYNRVLLSSLLAGEIAASRRRAEAAALVRASNGITLLTGARRRARLRRRGEAELATARALAFDKLVLATGSQPIRLPVPGSDLAGVITFRDLDDVDAMRRGRGRRAAPSSSAADCSASRRPTAWPAGAAVTLVHLMDRLMERQLDARGRRLLKRAVEGKGIEVAAQAQTRAIPAPAWPSASSSRTAARIARRPRRHGGRHQARYGAAERAGLTIGRGIVVDDRLADQRPGIYALGECAEHRGAVLRPGRARLRAGARCWRATSPARRAATRLAARQRASRSRACRVFSIGDFEGEGAETMLLRGREAAAYRKLVLRDDRLVGAVLFGDTAEALWYRDLIRQQARRRRRSVARSPSAGPIAEAA